MDPRTWQNIEGGENLAHMVGGELMNTIVNGASEEFTTDVLYVNNSASQDYVLSDSSCVDGTLDLVAPAARLPARNGIPTFIGQYRAIGQEWQDSGALCQLAYTGEKNVRGARAQAGRARDRARARSLRACDLRSIVRPRRSIARSRRPTRARAIIPRSSLVSLSQGDVVSWETNNRWGVQGTFSVLSGKATMMGGHNQNNLVFVILGDYLAP